MLTKISFLAADVHHFQVIHNIIRMDHCLTLASVLAYNLNPAPFHCTCPLRIAETCDLCLPRPPVCTS